MVKKPLAFALVLGALFGLLQTAGLAQIQPGTKCPVMPGEQAKEKFYIDYLGQRIHVCCRNCERRFKKHPEKYLKNLKNQNQGG